MKAKEFLNKIMRDDKTTIRKHTGVIYFDEKGNVISDESSDDSLKIVSLCGRGEVVAYVFTKSDTTISTDGCIFYINNQVVSGEFMDTQMTLDADFIAEINVDLGIDLDDSWIGGHYYVGYVKYKMLAGNYSLKIKTQDITLKTTFTVPVSYWLLKIKVADDFEYYVAIRNTEGQPRDWNYTPPPKICV